MPLPGARALRQPPAGASVCVLAAALLFSQIARARRATRQISMLRALSGLGAQSPTSAGATPAQQLVQVSVPANALEGDILQIVTELGMLEVEISKKKGTLKPGKAIPVNIDLPDDFEKTKKISVGATILQRNSVEVAPPTPVSKIRVLVPASAKPGDTLTIHTAAGTFDFNLPAAYDRTINVELPLELSDGASLDGKALTVTKLLLNGVDIASTAAPLKRPAASSATGYGDKAQTRRVVFDCPKGAKEDDTVELCTELGLYQIKVPARAGKQLEAHLPVPADFALPTLHVAWSRKVEPAPTGAEPVPAPTPPRAAPAPPAKPPPPASASVPSSVVDYVFPEPAAAAMPEADAHADAHPTADASAAAAGMAAAATHASPGPAKDIPSPAAPPTPMPPEVAVPVTPDAKPPPPPQPSGPCEALAKACRCIPGAA